MSVSQVVQAIDAETARSFVVAARHVIDALLIEGQRVRQTRTPAPRDYASAGLDRSAPGGGWIGDDELRATSQRLTEAIAAEKWTEGVLFAIRALSALGVGL